MAGDAGLRNAQKAARQVLDLDRRARGGDDVVDGVAASAGHSGMLAFENVTGELVIEGLGVPLDERKILTVVFGVAAGALIAGALRNVVGSVKSLARGETGRNFSVAVETLQRGRGTELVTSGAVGGAAKRLMRPRKRTGRNLGPCRRQEPQQTKCRQSFEQKLCQSRRWGMPVGLFNNCSGRLIKTA